LKYGEILWRGKGMGEDLEKNEKSYEWKRTCRVWPHGGRGDSQLVEASLCIVRQPQQPPSRLPLLAHVGLRAVPPGGGVGGDCCRCCCRCGKNLLQCEFRFVWRGEFAVVSGGGDGAMGARWLFLKQISTIIDADVGT
jgi:hypothetical protein